MNIPKNKIQWKRVPYLRQGESKKYDYKLLLNEPLASWDVFNYWERERIISMRANLRKGDVLFDVGTEQGWCDLVYATMVGPKNMVLIEPTPEFWPNIQALWQKNYPMTKPLAFYDGLFSDKTTEKRNGNTFYSWPASSKGDLIDKNSYKLIHEHGEVIPQLKIDDFVKITEIIPDALTVDVEGAELLVLKGAQDTLEKNRLKVWVSEHDDLAKRDYDIDPEEVASFMGALGYSREVIATDHERHVFYYK